MEFLVISQARMTSSRLPGKVLKEIFGKSLMEFHTERILRSKKISKLVIATTINKQDDPIVDFCNKMKIDNHRGSELDVLSRYWEVSQLYKSRYCIRVTSDCPLIDPKVIDLTINQFLGSGCDYFSNSECFPNGMNVEIFSSEMLNEAYCKGLKPYEREHVTPYFYTNPEKFKLGQVKLKKPYPKYRLTVDTLEDFALIKEIIERIWVNNKEFDLDNICALLKKQPELLNINQHIIQKKFNE